MNFVEEIQKLGLSEKEAQVYLASMRLGPASAASIAKEAKLPRTTTYSVLESLVKKGIATTIKDQEKQLFIVDSPQYLLEHAKRKIAGLQDGIQKFESISGELELQIGGDKPVAKIYEGQEGIFALIKSIKNDKPPVFFEIGDTPAVNKVIDMNLLDPIKKFIRSTSKIYGIYYNPDDDTVNENYRFLPDDHPQFYSDILVYDKKIVMFSLSGHLYALMIESKPLADAMKILFKKALCCDCSKKHE